MFFPRFRVRARATLLVRSLFRSASRHLQQQAAAAESGARAALLAFLECSNPRVNPVTGCVRIWRYPKAYRSDE